MMELRNIKLKIITKIMMYIEINKQCGNYGIGGEYMSHMDKLDNIERHRSETGDRLATIVTILQSPIIGT